VKGKILLYTGVFFLASLLLGKITNLFEMERLKSIQAKGEKIKQFTLIGIGDGKYRLKGDTLYTKGKDYYIDKFNLEYTKGREKIKVLSNKGVYNSEDETLNLQGDVQVILQNLKMETDNLKVLVKEKRAFNTTDTKITSKQMLTTGRNVFIDFKKNRLKLEDVKTVYRGG